MEKAKSTIELEMLLEGFLLARKEGAEGNPAGEELSESSEDELDMDAGFTEPILGQSELEILGEELLPGWGEPSDDTQEPLLSEPRKASIEKASIRMKGNAVLGFP